MSLRTCRQMPGCLLRTGIRRGEQGTVGYDDTQKERRQALFLVKAAAMKCKLKPLNISLLSGI